MSTGDPTARRSRPLVHSSQTIPAIRTARSPPPIPAVTGVTEKALGRLHRSTSIGTGVGTTPVGNPTTTVSPSNGSRAGSRPLRGPGADSPKVAFGPRKLESEHGRLEPLGPAKQAIRWMSAGAVTVAPAWLIG